MSITKEFVLKTLAAKKKKKLTIVQSDKAAKIE